MRYGPRDRTTRQERADISLGRATLGNHDLLVRLLCVLGRWADGAFTRGGGHVPGRRRNLPGSPGWCGQIDAAHQAANGGPARIPNGRVIRGTGVNIGWSWHLEDVEFAELTTEVCDGRPSDVEREGVTFGGGRFCPWTARVISIAEE